jgi:hypothetical protein
MKTKSIFGILFCLIALFSSSVLTIFILDEISIFLFKSLLTVSSILCLIIWIDYIINKTKKQL